MPNHVPREPGIVLRPARPADTTTLARIFVAAFQHGYPDVLPPDVLATVDLPSTMARFLTWNDAAGLQTVIAQRTDDGENATAPIGFTRFGNGELAALYVDPAASGAGVGRALLDHACHTMAAAGATTIRLWVFRANTRARRLYESAGFVVDGRELTDPEWQVPQIGMSRPTGRRPTAGQ